MRQLTCKAAIGFLDDYVEGRLTAEARAEFDAHLAQCPQCVDYLKTYRDTIALSRRACDEETIDVPEELANAILKTLKGGDE